MRLTFHFSLYLSPSYYELQFDYYLKYMDKRPVWNDSYLDKILYTKFPLIMTKDCDSADNCASPSGSEETRGFEDSGHKPQDEIKKLNNDGRNLLKSIKKLR